MLNFVPGVFLLFAAGLCLADEPVADPYKETKPAHSTQDTAEEAFLPAFSLEAATGYLDRRAHLMERNCYACHSTFTYLPARSLIDPLADEVMRVRVLLERTMTMLLDPSQSAQVKTQHISRVRILAALELARHDAATTGRLASITRQSLDAMWKLQTPQGGIAWLHGGEAPQAIDDWWPVVMIALGVVSAPESYAETEPAKANLEKLRGWFRAHPPQTLHERALTLVAHSAVGGILDDKARADHIEALFAKQHADGGWSMPDMAPWERKDKKPLNPARTDGYATALSVYAIVRNGVDPVEPRLKKAVGWIKTHQRETGGWFTQSPFARDIISSNTGTSFAIQALAACGEIISPKVTAAQFAAAHARAEQEVPDGQYMPNPSNP